VCECIFGLTVYYANTFILGCNSTNLHNIHSTHTINVSTPFFWVSNLQLHANCKNLSNAQRFQQELQLHAFFLKLWHHFLWHQGSGWGGMGLVKQTPPQSLFNQRIVNRVFHINPRRRFKSYTNSIFMHPVGSQKRVFDAQHLESTPKKKKNLFFFKIYIYIYKK